MIYNLEHEITSCPSIIKKVQESEAYAEDLYRALCNNVFRKASSQDDLWSCTWRYAGGVIAKIRNNGDYLDWYCSGGEGCVSEEVKKDLVCLGWIVEERGYDV